MNIEIIKCLTDNYSYLVIDSNKNALVVDPSEAKPIIEIIESKKLNLKFILNTHHHFDHVGGNKELKKKYDLKVIGFEGDKNRIPEIDITLNDKEIWKSNNFESKIYHIPGHTSGHICYHFFNQNILFTGDTLFSLGCGRIFEGTYEEMFDSLRRKVVKYGGYITMIKNSDYLPFVEDVFTINRDRFNISQNIKKSFDPKRILNPGKMYTGI